jgi:hypothetical protein
MPEVTMADRPNAIPRAKDLLEGGNPSPVNRSSAPHHNELRRQERELRLTREIARKDNEKQKAIITKVLRNFPNCSLDVLVPTDV